MTGRAVPLDRTDVDTDQIIPSDWLKRVERTGFGAGLFAEWRDDRDFVLNDAEYAGATILVAGPNFGTGSSREHAVWALMDYGFQAVVSPALRRHLPQQLHQLRPGPRRGDPRGRAAPSSTRSKRTLPSRSPSTSSAAWSRRRRPGSWHLSPWTPMPATASCEGSTTSASPSSTRQAIASYEARRAGWLPEVTG